MIDKSNPWVVCAAMKMNDGSLVLGVRHFSPDMRATMKLAYGDGYHLKVSEQGFVDQFGQFLTREEAWVIAEKNGQIRYRVSSAGTLYSENLY